MDWIKINIKTDDIDTLTQKLIMNDIYEYEIIEDYNSICKQLDSQIKYWDFIDEEKIKKNNQEQMIICYVSKNDKAKFQNIINAIEGYTYIVGDIVDEDWVNSWKKHFSSIDIGENIIIVPIWEEINTKKTVLKIDPGMIFGTGSHETTQLCICEIEKYVKQGDSILDLGCGSGILSIIAKLLGAKNATCVDIDEGASKVVLENAKNNNVKIEQVFIGDLLCDDELLSELKNQKYELIVANIVAGVIIEILPLVKQCLKNEGIFICSGIIDDKIEMTENALINNDFNIINKQIKGEWAVFTTELK